MRYSRLYPALVAVVMVALLVAPLTIRAASTPSNSFEIVSVTTRAEDGTPKTEFRRGEFVFVEVTVRRSGGGYYYYYYTGSSFLAIARATMGSPPTLYGLGGFRGSLGAGEEITAEIAFRIPRNAPTGTMKITVFVWSNWAYLGGVPVASPVEVTITVKP